MKTPPAYGLSGGLGQNNRELHVNRYYPMLHPLLPSKEHASASALCLRGLSTSIKRHEKISAHLVLCQVNQISPTRCEGLCDSAHSQAITKTSMKNAKKGSRTPLLSLAMKKAHLESTALQSQPVLISKGVTSGAVLMETCLSNVLKA
jgi:hypothetical protein